MTKQHGNPKFFNKTSKTFNVTIQDGPKDKANHKLL